MFFESILENSLFQDMLDEDIRLLEEYDPTVVDCVIEACEIDLNQDFYYNESEGDRPLTELDDIEFF